MQPKTHILKLTDNGAENALLENQYFSGFTNDVRAIY